MSRMCNAELRNRSPPFTRCNHPLTPPSVTLHATPNRLSQAAGWLPAAWPHLLQLLLDPHNDVRTAAAGLLGHVGCTLACAREPRLAARLPPSALLDWCTTMLSPHSSVPAAQRMSADAKVGRCRAKAHACMCARDAHAKKPHVHDTCPRPTCTRTARLLAMAHGNTHGT